MMDLCRSDRYDLIIVGAGMVGASLACILERTLNNPDKKVSILLVESAPVDLDAPPAQPSFDARSTVLSYGTVEYFRELGLWHDLAGDAEPITRIHVSDQGRFGAVRMSSVDMGVDALGYVIENRLLGAVLNRALAQAPGLELCSGVSVTGIRPMPEGMEVDLSGGEHIASVAAPLVVLAEGGRSGICDKLGIHRHSQDYQQEAVIANVAFSRSHDNVAYERFTSNGPLAFLPLPDLDGEHRAALVWTRPDGEAETLLALPDAEFLARLQDEFGNRLGQLTRVGRRASYPLSLVEAEEQIRPGLVLLGNAAHSLHPVAGQGFNLAFRDTMRLAAMLVDAVDAGTDPGDFNLLKNYLAGTTADQDRTAAFSHYMTRLFSSDRPAAVWARKFGMFSIDLVPPLKKAFARRAM